METERTAEQALTDHVRLVLDNEFDLYKWRREIVRDFLAGPDAQYPHLLGERLAEWCDGLVEEAAAVGGDAGLAGEMLGVALAFVDWRDVAEDYIAEEREPSA